MTPTMEALAVFAKKHPSPFAKVEPPMDSAGVTMTEAYRTGYCRFGHGDGWLTLGRPYKGAGTEWHYFCATCAST